MARTVKEILLPYLQHHTDWRLSLLHNWSQLIGMVARYAKIEKITDDTIFLGVTDPHWMHEIYNLQTAILHKVNNHIHPHELKIIQCRLVKNKKEFKSKKTHDGLKCSIPTREISAAEYNILQSLSDNELRSALQNFLFRTRT